MYRQINIAPSDREFQSIVWRVNAENDLIVTYGPAPASFLAARTLQQIGNEFETKYPLASKTKKKLLSRRPTFECELNK